MIIQKDPVKLDGEVIEPKHTIEIYCPNCGRDVDETELTNQVCNDCGQDLSQPKQSVAIEVTTKPIGTKVWGQ